MSALQNQTKTHIKEVLVLGEGSALEQALKTLLDTSQPNLVHIHPRRRVDQTPLKAVGGKMHLHLCCDYEEGLSALKGMHCFDALLMSREAKEAADNCTELLAAVLKDDAVVYMDFGVVRNLAEGDDPVRQKEAQNPCQLCEGSLDWLTFKHDVHVYRCSECGLTQVDFRSQEDRVNWLAVYQDNGSYHRERQLSGYTSFAARYVHDLYIADGRLDNIIKRMPQSSPIAATLLDIGCSNGALVKAAADKGFYPVGIDADEWVIKEGQKYHGCTVFAQDPLAFQPEVGFPFDVITVIDVFEHFHDPQAYMSKLNELLADGGMLVIEMPDADAPGFQRMGWDWKHFKPREHAFYYGLRHVETLADMFGFKVVDHLVPYPDRRTYYLERK